MDGPSPHERLDEQQLIARARSGDAAAERALYEAHVDRVYRLAFLFAGSDELAREFTQDAFVRAFQRLDEFRGTAAFSTWMHTITVSVSLNGMRQVKRRRQREVGLEAAADVGTRGREAEPDLKRRLAEAVEELPDAYRATFVMHDVEGYTHEEIGAALGVATGTSKANLSRARAKLRDALRSFAGEWVQ